VAARCIQSETANQEVYTNNPAGFVSLSYYLGHDIFFLPEHSNIEDWSRTLPFLTARQSPGWMALVSNASDSMQQFEERLNQRQIPYTKNTIPGNRFPVVLYHIVPTADR
jgi:hypothetical protein